MGEGSNLHAFRRTILRRVCLPMREEPRFGFSGHFFFEVCIGHDLNLQAFSAYDLESYVNTIPPPMQTRL